MLEYVLCPTNGYNLENIRYSNNSEIRNAIRHLYKKSDLAWVYSDDEIEEKVANACGWCESAEAGSVYEGEIFTIKVREKDRTYYTLRAGKALKEEIYSIEGGAPIEFASFELAYAEMVNIYNRDKEAGCKPKLYGIWRTRICNGNSMTQAVWTA